MTEDPTGNSKAYDPLKPFLGMRDAYLDAMAKTMVEAVNTDAYAQASGAMLDSTLALSAPFREALEKSMLQVLQQLSLPSRQDIVALADRFTNLEMRLDDMDAGLDTVQRSMLPILQQLVLLTEQFTALTSRPDTNAVGQPRRQSSNAKVQPATQTAAKVLRTKKRAEPAAKTTRVRRAARKGAS